MPVAPDIFLSNPPVGYAGPYVFGVAVTPSDVALNELPNVTRALMVGVGGTLSVKLMDNTTVALTVPTGLLELRVRQVFATGTAATNITALW
jgi:hypothetical protein